MAGWPESYGKRVLAEVDSTNAEAARIAPMLSGPEWILGLKQTAGRGRRGRDWKATAGNFTATLVMRPSETPDQVALRSFVAALALFDALDAATGRTDWLSLKWPNDVLLKGGKVAGILLESAGLGQGVGHIAIGIGVNLVEAPPRAKLESTAMQPVSVLAETGVRIRPEDFLELLAAAYARHEDTFQTLGFGPLRNLWLSRAAKIGEVITARTMRDEVTGTFETVDAQGNLVLKTAKARETIPAADIFF
ncbi:MAG: biotin--[acetyl-CoA-carboxylase] ligase [Paracoccaceae bacterium]|nr:biotin--[acetyl-CoA-carboxylase] ligase [Paracoccaceae bacterium]MDG1736815.1 biotin--[acetyl-CoA-carboxylase] ligase [Paracoccaceae bacterium]MDG2260350.1 biotin--[acetyl-CoA-carboxylase] ligase [Paracoccaceae bacterium]